MTSGIKKIKIMAGTAFVITMISSNAHAFGIPLLSADMQRIVTSVKVTMNEIMIIKQEVESNLKIIEEIRNGGFASAGAMIFDKIQNGDYDRFGKALSNVRNEGMNAADSVKARKKYKEFEEQARKEGKSEEEAKAIAQKKVADYLDAERASRLQRQQEARESRGDNAFSKSYNWLKKNQSFTSGTSSALRGVDSNNWGQVLSGATGAAGGAIGSNAVGNAFSGAAQGAGNTLNNALSGDWGQALSGASGVAGGVIGNNSVGNVFSGASQSAGSALDSALSGDWSDFTASASQSVGVAVGGATGSQGLGNVIGGAGAIGAGVTQIVGEGGDAGQVINNTVNNGYLNSGLDNTGSGYNQMDAALNAAAEAQAAENRRSNEQAARSAKDAEADVNPINEKLKQQMCNECQQKNGGMAGCASVCM